MTTREWSGFLLHHTLPELVRKRGTQKQAVKDGADYTESPRAPSLLTPAKPQAPSSVGL